MPKRSGKKSAAQTPAPPAERIQGSKVNPKGSAASEKSASAIKVSEQTESSLRKKLEEFKKKYPAKDNVNMNDLKAVYRRGAGAYSSTHRPTITGGRPNSRSAWALARVNKFLEKAAGKKVKKAYVQDDDLLKYQEGGKINTETMFFWHGGDLNNYDEIIAQKSGRYEYGAGLYLTTELQVAVKYAKGSRRLYLIEVEKGIDINDATISEKDAHKFINTHVKSLKRKEIKKRLLKYTEEGKVKANVFNNVILNEKAIQSTKTYELRDFYVRNGIDYEIVDNAYGWGEKMMVLYNMKKIVDKKVVKESDAYKMELPKFKEGGILKIGDTTNVGIIEDEYENQYKVNGKWYHKSVVKGVESSDDNISVKANHYKSKLISERGKGNITLYHGTDIKKYEEIEKSGVIGKENAITFFTSSKSEAKNYAENKAKYRGVEGGKVLEITMPKWAVQKNRATGEYETEFVLKRNDAGVYVPTDESVVEEYKNSYAVGGELMLAPNGKPSFLTSDLYKIVRTPAFKEWFGDWENDPENASKMLDENGEPCVTYHGTNSVFDVFDISNFGMRDSGFYGVGFYFVFYPFKPSSAIGEARYYGARIIPAFLNIRNPFNIESLSVYRGYRINAFVASGLIFMINLHRLFPNEEFFGVQRKTYGKRDYDGSVEIIKEDLPISTLSELFEKYEKEVEWIDKGDRLIALVDGKYFDGFDLIETNRKNGFYGDDLQLAKILLIAQILEKKHNISVDYQPEGIMTRNPKVSELIKKYGYDGVLQSLDGDEAVVFEPNQIKLADGTNTTFMRTTKDIRFEDGGVVSTYMNRVKGQHVETGKSVTIKTLKNTEKAPFLGKRFGQDVEPAGIYVIQKETDYPLNGWVQGQVVFSNPLVIDVTDDTMVEWKRELSAKYGGKKQHALTKQLMKEGYDGIITRKNNELGEIIIFNNAKYGLL